MTPLMDDISIINNLEPDFSDIWRALALKRHDHTSDLTVSPQYHGKPNSGMISGTLTDCDISKPPNKPIYTEQSLAHQFIPLSV